MSCPNVVLFFSQRGFPLHVGICCTMGSLHAQMFASRNKNQRLFLRYLVMKATQKGPFSEWRNIFSFSLYYLLVSTLRTWAEGMQFYCRFFPYYTILTFFSPHCGMWSTMYINIYIPGFLRPKLKTRRASPPSGAAWILWLFSRSPNGCQIGSYSCLLPLFAVESLMNYHLIVNRNLTKLKRVLV